MSPYAVVVTQQYVCGFAIDPRISPEMGEVMLLRKKRTARWNAGLWNGLGGRIEEHDASIENTMYREFREESGGLPVYAANWRHFHTDVWEANVHTPPVNPAELGIGSNVMVDRAPQVQRTVVYYLWAHLPSDVMRAQAQVTQQREEPCDVFTYSRGQVLRPGWSQPDVNVQAMPTAPDVPHLVAMAMLDYARYTNGSQRPVPARYYP